VDITWMQIKLLEKLGIASNVKEASVKDAESYVEQPSRAAA